MAFFESLSRSFFLRVSENRMLNKAAKKWGLKFGASSVVAGDNLDAAIEKVKKLNEDGLTCTMDNLGEFVSSKEEATAATKACLLTLEAIDKSKVACNLSVKMTQLGLDIDFDFVLNNMREIVGRANELGIFVNIDMEDSPRTQITLDILAELHKDYQNVGTVIQSYLHRSEEDIKNLKGTRIRFVKGAYKEPESVAIQNKPEIDENLMKIIKLHLLNDSYTSVASHDHNIIDKVKEFTTENNISKDKFEFQFLYGFRTELQLKLVEEGYTVRVYVPFGTDWFGYFMRRLAERPQNIGFAFRGMFSKK